MTVRLCRIGLTGGIAAGKSTVAARLVRKGALLIDYDVLAKRVVQPDSPCLEQIAQVFGPDALNADGSMNRAWMAAHVFGDNEHEPNPQAREQLDAIIHPAVLAKAAHDDEAAVQAAAITSDLLGCVTVIVHDIPLLTEVIGELPWHFDHIVTVEADDDIRVARMVQSRGMSEAEARARIASQAAASERIALSDIVIDANVPREQVNHCVDELYKRWIKQANKHASRM